MWEFLGGFYQGRREHGFIPVYSQPARRKRVNAIYIALAVLLTCVQVTFCSEIVPKPGTSVAGNAVGSPVGVELVLPRVFVSSSKVLKLQLFGKPQAIQELLRPCTRRIWWFYIINIRTPG